MSETLGKVWPAVSADAVDLHTNSMGQKDPHVEDGSMLQRQGQVPAES